MHYYQFNIGDYKSHTDYLSPIEDLAYRRMLDLCYLHEKPLPKTANEVARKIGLRDHVIEVELVLNDFFENTEDGYVNFRVNEEIEAYKAKADSARNNGKKGGRPRKETQVKPKKTQPVNLANPEETGSQANHKPLTINQEPLTNNQLKDKPSKLDFSVLQMTDEQCKDVVRIRKKNKGTALTQLIIDQLAKQFFLAAEKGFSFQDSLIEWEVRGWKSFKAEWMKSPNNQNQQSNSLQTIQAWRPKQ